MNGYHRKRGCVSVVDRLSASRAGANQLIPRWLFLRGLGAIYCSAFFALIFQIHGLIGRQGILPASSYLQAVGRSIGGWQSLWYAPTVLWFSTAPVMLSIICWVGIVASVLLVLNLWPRGMLLICFLCFLSFVSAAQEFSGYQSDGMLLEAGFLSLFFAPRGVRPGLAVRHPAPCASLFLLQWEWFRIYFESGMVKLLSGDPQWRNFTAMDEYYQNGPLPTWIGWYVQHLPHWFHAAYCVRDACPGTWPGMDALSAAALANCVLLYRYSVAGRGNPDRELHISELPGIAVWECCCSTTLSSAASYLKVGSCDFFLRLQANLKALLRTIFLNRSPGLAIGEQ